ADASDLITNGSLAGGGTLSGKIFANIGGTEVHGIVRMNASGISGTSGASGQLISGAPILTPPLELPNPPTPTTPGMGIGTSVGAIDTSMGAGGAITNPSNPFVMPTGNGSEIGAGSTELGDLFGDTMIGGMMP